MPWISRRHELGKRDGINNPEPETERPTSTRPVGRPVDCLGLTKRWSLYVASNGNSGCTRKKRLTDLSRARQSLFTGSVRAVAPASPEPRLEQPALSLSHLTWSMGTSTTAF